MSEVTVHVGGHVTLLFSIHSNSLLSRNQGSKGAGFCLEDGVEVSIKRTENETDKISVTTIDGSTLDGGLKLYSDLIESFRELFQINERIDVDVRIRTSDFSRVWYECGWFTSNEPMSWRVFR